jgi:transmembrane sensor
MEQNFYDQLIVKSLNQQTTAAENTKLQEWIDISSENKAHYEALRSVWQKSGVKSEVPLIDKDEEWQKLASRLHLSASKAKTPVKWMRLAVAASFLVVLTTVLWWQLTEPASELMIAGNAETLEFTLADGSVIELNSGSALEYPETFSGDTREVVLRGEAYFRINPDRRPFIVHAGQTKIEVLGTRFNVFSRKQETRVTVAHGRVAFYGQGKQRSDGVLLGKNETASARAAVFQEATLLANAEDAIGWRQGRLVFTHSNLQDIAEELTRRYDVQVQLDNPALANLTLSGSFRQKSLPQVLNAICLALDLEYREANGVYRISKNN